MSTRRRNITKTLSGALLCLAMLFVTLMGFLYPVEAGATEVTPPVTSGLSADHEQMKAMHNTVTTPYILFVANGEMSLSTYCLQRGWDCEMQYSTDGSTWATWTGALITAPNGMLYLRGSGNTCARTEGTNYRFVLTGERIRCYGNIMSLLDYTTVSTGGMPTMSEAAFSFLFHANKTLVSSPLFPATSLKESCYSNMFSGCSALLEPPELPATTLAEYCYESMFYGCTSLAYAPALPATVMANSCYKKMFYKTNIRFAPALPATMLATSCYQSMFEGCKNLRKPPALPATVLTNRCYYDMFADCTSLKGLPVMAPTKLADSCCAFMFSGCSALKVSTNQSGECVEHFRIDAENPIPSRWGQNMFESTGDASVGADASAGKDYYYNVFEEYPVWVNGILVAEDNASDVLGALDGDGATVVYDPTTQTLTLNGANLVVDSRERATYMDRETPYAHKCGIYSTVPLTIVYSGTNTITAAGTDGFGIDLGGANLTLKPADSDATIDVRSGWYGIRAATLDIPNNTKQVYASGSMVAISAQTQIADGYHKVGSSDLNATASTATTAVTDGTMGLQFSDGTIARTVVIAHHMLSTMANATQHYTGCACGYAEEDSYQNHTPADDDGDCTTAVTCTFCQYVTTEAHGSHDYTGDYQHDADGHWRKCTRCDVIDAKVAHTSADDDGDCTSEIKCTVCQYVTTAALSGHDYEEDMRSTEQLHWRKCKNCEVTTEKTAHNAHEDDDNCTTATLCQSCEYVLVAAKEHVLSKFKSEDTEGHWYDCSFCNQKVDYAAHDFTGDYYVDADGHWHVCKGCTVVDTKVEHTPGEEDNNCLTPVLCTICEYEIEAGGGHSYIDDGDCTTEERCTVCNIVITEAREVHEWEDTLDCTTPTKCKHCDAVQNEAIHDYSAAYLSDENGHWHKCTRCEVTDTALPHTAEVDDHNCLTAQACSTCGYVLVEARAHHDPRNDRTDCTVAVLCLYCDQVHTAPEAAHIPSNEDHDCSTPTVCTVCGTTIKAAREHDFTGVWLFGDNGHWHKCENDNCLVVSAVALHERGEDDGDCTSPIKCTSCDYYFVANEHHTPEEDDGTCLTALSCVWCDVILKPKRDAHDFTGEYHLVGDEGHKRQCAYCVTLGELEEHTPAEDDHDCTTKTLCTACGYVLMEKFDTHDFAGEYFHDENGHWRKCSRCEALEESDGHTLDEDDGDCTTDILCAVCDRLMETGNEAHDYLDEDGDCLTLDKCGHCDVTRQNTEHTFTGVATYDNTHHWNQCMHCQVISDEKIMHKRAQDDGDCTTAVPCTGCGFIFKPAKGEHEMMEDDFDCTTPNRCKHCDYETGEVMKHDFSGEYIRQTDGHRRRCINCSKSGEKVPHVPADTDNNCLTEALCIECGGVALEAKLAHDFTGAHLSDVTGHWHKCQNCAVTDGVTPHQIGQDLVCVTCGYFSGDRITIIVVGGTVSGGSETTIVVNENGTVTITANVAPDGMIFVGWKHNGEIVSTDVNYTFTASADSTYEAVWGNDIAELPPADTEPPKGDDNEGDGNLTLILIIVGVTVGALTGIVILVIALKKKQGKTPSSTKKKHRRNDNDEGDW